MSVRYWTGRGQDRKQVNTITPTAANAATYTITINTKTVTYLSDASATVAEITAGLAAAGQASEDPEFQEIEWTDSTTLVTATARTAGKPFTQTSSASAGTLVTATSVANLSRSDINDADNWGDGVGGAGAVPISGDSIVAENGSIPMLYNLDALAAVDIASMIARKTYTARIGLDDYTESGYYEYRARELALQTCTVLYEEQPDGLATGQRRYNVGANACTYTCNGSGSSSIGNEVTWLRGTSTSNAFEVNGGSVAIAALDSHTASLATLNMTTGATVRAGLNTTFSSATVKVTDSVLDVRSNITTLTVGGSSQITCWNTMTIGTFNLGSPCIYNSSGTITTLNLIADANGIGSIDFSNDRTARTITNAVQAPAGVTFNDPDGTVTMSAGIKYVQCRDIDVIKDFGVNRTISVA